MKKIVLSVFLIFFVFAFLFFSPLSPFMRDLEEQFHPWKTFIFQSLASGEFPFWNPYNFCGTPLQANPQAAVFYPLSILFCLFRWPASLKLFYFFSFFLLSTGFILLFWRERIWVGLIMTGLFLLNTLQLSQMEFLSGLGTSSWLGWLLFFFRKRKSLALGAVFLLSFLAGQPQLLFLHIVTLFFFIREAGDISLLFRAGVAALLLSLPQFVPSFLFYLHSSWINLGEGGRLVHSLLPGELFYFLNPFHGLSKPYSLDIYRLPYWIKSAYFGLVPLLLAFSGIYFSLKKKKLRPVLLAAAGLFIALGDNFFLSRFLWNLWPVSFIRYPARFLWLALAGGLLLVHRALGEIRRGLILSIIFLAVFFDLGITQRRLSFLEYPEIFRQTGPKIERLKKDKGLWRFFLTPYTQEHRSGLFWKKRENLFSNLNLLFRFSNLTGQDVQPERFAAVFEMIQEKSTIQEALPLLRLFNVRYVLSLLPLPEKDFSILSAGDYGLYEIQDCGPRFALTRNVFHSGDIKKEMADYRSGKFFLERISGVYGGEFSGAIEERVLSGNFQRFSVSTDSQSLFAAAENYYPGWRVYVNGKKKEILPVNYAMRGVLLEEKENRILFLYRPLVFSAALLFSMLLFGMLLYRNIGCILSPRQIRTPRF
ncbi:MAG TPA: hypothetical protein VJC03_02155 [bacterium]|nr:hypothetical protein [bacterium]